MMKMKKTMIYIFTIVVSMAFTGCRCLNKAAEENTQLRNLKDNPQYLFQLLNTPDDVSKNNAIIKFVETQAGLKALFSGYLSTLSKKYPLWEEDLWRMLPGTGTNSWVAFWVDQEGLHFALHVFSSVSRGSGGGGRRNRDINNLPLINSQELLGLIGAENMTSEAYDGYDFTFVSPKATVKVPTKMRVLGSPNSVVPHISSGRILERSSGCPNYICVVRRSNSVYPKIIK